MIKRLFDILITCVALIIFFVPMVIISILVYCFLGRPIFFKQQRPGLNEKIFYLIKFRTMKNDLQQSNPNDQILPDEVRITEFGKILRALSLDELPTLFNVIKGDMSLVGPRPLLVKYIERYSSEERKRHNVKPGITGLAQINGRNSLSWEEKFKYDVWYVNNRSLWLDIKILIKTIKKVFTREGIDSPGFVSGQEFAGKNDEKK